MTDLMSRSQLFIGECQRLALDMHGLIFETSI